jgi:hypothetical protein
METIAGAAVSRGSGPIFLARRFVLETADVGDKEFIVQQTHS